MKKKLLKKIIIFFYIKGYGISLLYFVKNMKSYEKKTYRQVKEYNRLCMQHANHSKALKNMPRSATVNNIMGYHLRKLYAINRMLHL